MPIARFRLAPCFELAVIVRLIHQFTENARENQNGMFHHLL